MPTYQYHCTKCDQEFDVFQSMTDNALTTCPKDLCRMGKWGKGKVKKLISAGAGLIFKGSGFYITDYRSDSYKEAAKKDSSAAAPAASESKAGSTTGETKTAPAKTEPKSSKPESKPAK
jgi:putative FmdB family regulatory protein